MESDGKNMSWETIKGRGYSDAYQELHRSLRDSLKRYLGYPPYNGPNNPHKRCPKYAQYLEKTHGRSLKGLLKKAGMKDFGETSPPADRPAEPSNAIIKSLKRIYEVEELYFWIPHRYPSNRCIWECSTNKSNIKGEIIASDFKFLLRVLSGESKSTREVSVTSVDSGNKHVTLDSLREEILVMKLSGLL